MSKCDGCIEEIRKLLDSAKREPAHSPTEDALIDAVEMLLELVTNRISERPTQGSETRPGVEGAHEGTTADKNDPHEIAKKIVEEHAWERASGGFYIDEVNFENLLIDIAEAIHDAGSREPEKLWCPECCTESGKTEYGDCTNSFHKEPEKLNNAQYDAITCTNDRSVALAESSLSPPSGKVINVSEENS